MPEHSSPRLHVSGRGRASLPAHRLPSLSRRLRSLLPLLLPAALASCVQGNENTDRREQTTAPPPSVDGGNRPALPSPAPSAVPPAGPQALLADSAAALDSLFQQARLAINRDARALDAPSADLRSAAYASRFDDVRRRTLAAESLRARRDRLRTRLVKMRAARRDTTRATRRPP